MGKYEASIVWFEKALNINPLNKYAIYGIGI